MAAAVGAGTGGGAGTVGRGRTGPPGALSATAGALGAPHAPAGNAGSRAGAGRGVQGGGGAAHTAVVDAGAARRLGIPVVTTVHGYTGGSWRNRLYERLQRRAFRRFDAVVAVSQRLADSLTHDGVPRDRVHLIRNAWAGAEPLLDRD